LHLAIAQEAAFYFVMAGLVPAIHVFLVVGL